MKFPFKRITIKFLKVTGISIGSILLLLYLIPVLFPGTVGEKVKAWANDHIEGEMNFSKLRLSFFSHFPSFTVSLYDFSLKGSAPFKKDTLVASKEIAFGINIKSLLFDSKVRIDKIFLDDADLHVQVNANGEANYNVYKSKASSSTSTDTAGTALRLEKISLNNCHLIYDDRSLPMHINANGFDYKGDGDLSKSIFDLNSHIEIEALDFSFGNEPYLRNKNVKADLITQVNTNSLAFIFQKNILKINQLPVEFTGKLDFLKNGYDIDFTVTSKQSDLDDVVTALPPQYVSWQKNTTIKGVTDILLTLKGQYIASTGSMPSLAYNMMIKDGYIKYGGAPVPAENLYVDCKIKLPSLNTDSLSVVVDLFFFNVDKDHLAARFRSVGLDKPVIDASLNASMDLEKMDKALGLQDVDLKGQCNIDLTAKGLYATGPDPNTIRHKETVLSIPSFSLNSSIRNGYLKYASLPQAVNNISCNIKAACADHDYRNTGFSISDISITALNNFIKGHVSVSSIKQMMVDAGLQASIDLADIKKLYPVTDTRMNGMLKCDIKSKGVYDATTHRFPLTTADIRVDNATLLTAYYPRAISNINIYAKATNRDGTLQGQDLIIQPASFVFDGKPFEVQASFKNFDDIQYDVKAKGELDLEKIYKVFSQKGVDVTGYIKADVHFSGRQSDAVNKQYNKLYNEGTLELKDIATTTEYLPKPFVIKEGLFSFQQDKMRFANFKAAYGSSDMQMNGYLQNVLAYALSPSGVLKGSFNLHSNYFNVDEWMVYARDKKDTLVKVDSTVQTGVVVIPSNLDLSVSAAAKKVSFNGIHLDNAKGDLVVSNGVLQLKKTGFNLIGSETVMDATYTSSGINKAQFDFSIAAKEFDIKKAYDSVKLFRDMATAAGSAQGIVSLDYKVKGVLDGNMQPIYPSLEGGGVLSVKQVKVKGFRLFSVVSRKTGKDSIANPDVSKVDIKSHIRNNIISIERFKIKMLGFRLRMEGQTGFDGKLKLKIRLGLPPLGIIGIPMNVTGTQDNPKIKLGRGDNEQLTETEYKEEGIEMPVKEEKKE